MIVIQVRCSDCDKLGLESRGPKAQPAHILRHNLESEGWKIIESGGRDYCPDCWKVRTDAGLAQ